MKLCICLLCVIIICLVWRTEKQKQRQDEIEKEMFIKHLETEDLKSEIANLKSEIEIFKK